MIGIKKDLKRIFFLEFSLFLFQKYTVFRIIRLHHHPILRKKL